MRFWNTLYRLKIHHVLLWTVYYLFFMFMYRGYYADWFSLFKSISVYFIFTAGTFYFISYYLFPRYLHQRKYSAFALASFGTVIVAALGLSTCIYFMLRDVAPQVAANTVLLYFISFLSVGTIGGILCAVKLLIEKIKGDRTQEILEKQRIESELHYLKAQVNPHFLFNAINNIYFLIRKDPDLAAETLIRLSDLLRFQLYDCTGEKINIESEIDYLKNFVALEEIRKGSRVKVELVTDESLQGFFLAPFMLIPFMENTFKFVANTEGIEGRIRIRLWREGELFHATFFNTTDNTIKNEVGGIGIKNVRRRLELLYPGTHLLEILQEKDTYTVNLTLKIK